MRKYLKKGLFFEKWVNFNEIQRNEFLLSEHDIGVGFALNCMNFWMVWVKLSQNKYVHPKGTEKIFGNFRKKRIFVCLLYCTHFWSAFLKKSPPPPSVGKDVILHICAKGFVLKTRTTETPNFPGRKFVDSYRHCLLRCY